MDFDILKILIFVAVIVWYIYSAFKKSQAKKTPQSQTQQVSPPKKTAESRPLDDVLKDLFGLPEVETPITPPPRPKPVIKEKKVETRRQAPSSPKRVSHRNVKQQKHIKPPSKQVQAKNLLTFSSNPLAQAIILSDVLGPPKSQRDDSLI